ncbi:hypothetical protein ACLOJK_036325 [Asimina triloba]
MRSFTFPVFVWQPWLPNPSPWPFSSTIHNTARPATTHNAHSSTTRHINGHDSSHPSRSSASPDPDADPASRLPSDTQRPCQRPVPCIAARLLHASFLPSSTRCPHAPSRPRAHEQLQQQSSGSKAADHVLQAAQIPNLDGLKPTLYKTASKAKSPDHRANPKPI